jgi:hypothetical protein
MSVPEFVVVLVTTANAEEGPGSAGRWSRSVSRRART